MSFELLHKRVTYLFAALGLAALMLDDTMSLPWRLIVILLAVASYRFEGPRVFAVSTTRLVTAVALVAFAVEIGRFVLLEADGVGLAVEYAALLQLTRLFQRRTSTEHLHVVGLGFLHLLASTILSTGLDFAVVFLGFVIVTPWMLSLTHLRGELERQHATKEELEHPPTDRLARALRSKGLASRSFLFGSSLLSLPLFAITAAFFLLFPRVGLGMFDFGGGREDTVAGFGDSIDLGRFGTIRDDPTIVARVFPPPGTELGRYRLRGTSFDAYDGIRWSRTPGNVDRFENTFGAILLDPERGRKPGLVTLRFLVEPVHEGAVFIPEGGVGLEVPPKVERGFTVFRRIHVRDGRDVRLLDEDGLPLEYLVRVDPDYRPRRERLGDETTRRYLEVPDGMQALADLAAEVSRGAGDDVGRAALIEHYLAETGGFTYTLETPNPGRTNPLVHFVTAGRRGHCEFFASAMVVMLRTLGIPARNVAGYLGGTPNAYGGYVEIHSGDAHSWVEAYVDGHFVTFDPTPSQREMVGRTSSWLAPFRSMLDAVRTRWNRYVVGYDMRRQIEIVLELRDLWRERNGPAGGRTVRIEDGSTSTRSGRAPVYGLACVGVVMIGIAVALLLARTRRPPETIVTAAERLYRRLDELLALAGSKRDEAVTPREQLDHVRLAHPEFAALAEAVTEAHERARYAEGPSELAAMARLEERIDGAMVALRSRQRTGAKRPIQPSDRIPRG